MRDTKVGVFPVQAAEGEGYRVTGLLQRTLKNYAL